MIGATGTVVADALAPYEVFAWSQRFFVYTVGADRTPAALSGGLHLLPDRTFADVTARPDVVVAPAVVDLTGARERRCGPGSPSRKPSSGGVRGRAGTGRGGVARR